MFKSIGQFIGLILILAAIGLVVMLLFLNEAGI